MSRKLYLSLAAVATAFALAACGSDDVEQGDPNASSEGTAAASQGQGGQGQGGQAEMPEPDLENIPDVVATVNGEDISGEEFSSTYEAQFSQMAMQAQMSGEEIDQNALKQQTLEGVVGNELLVMDANEKGMEASDEQVDEFLNELASSNQMESVDDLFAQFEEQGMSEERVREDAAKQLKLDQLIESMDVEEPTDEELQEMYDQQVAQQEQMQGGQGGEGSSGSAAETPPFEELKPQLEQQATQQKQSEAVNAHVEELRADAEVETHLETGSESDSGEGKSGDSGSEESSEGN